jgi:hypothetical protein
MKKYKFLENFLFNGVFYEKGQEYNLDPGTIAALPNWVAEEVLPPKSSKTKEVTG